MGIVNLLANWSSAVRIGVYPVGSIDLNWLASLIKGLIECIHINTLIDTGLGIVLFTLILKTIVLPLDIYSRVATKKQSLAMEKMRPQMEKLQKQYANDKAMYSQKVNELYKKNGYSMFGACIPMIVSLVIFIFVFQAFSSYSRYANFELYHGMVDAYNSVVQEYVYDENTELPEGYLGKEGFVLHFEGDGQSESTLKKNSAEYGKNEDGTAVSYTYAFDYDAFEVYYNKLEDSSKLKNADEVTLTTATDLFAYYQTLYSEQVYKDNAVLDFIKIPARIAAATYFEENVRSFLWVGNIWYPDSMLNKALPGFSDFSKNVNNSAALANNDETDYNEVTYNLSSYKSQYNGYFVLIVLAIGLMFLQQFITSKSQKAVNELGSVDGSGARTNKYMMIIMPIIYGIFSFFYSAAFSIYMITNTVYSLITTLIINKVMDVVFAKREAKAEIERYTRVPSVDKKHKNKKK